MIAANGGRVFVKEVEYARFYVTLLEPMFRRKNNVPVPSMYFKLDPAQGHPHADNADRVVHLDVADSMHPAAVRFPLFRIAMQLDLNDSMIVNLDAHPKVWHQVDGRPPKDGGDPPDDERFPRPDDVVVYGWPHPTVAFRAAWPHT